MMNNSRALESHRSEQQDEDIAFLVQHGTSLEEALQRVGVSADAYEKRHQPARRKTA